MDELSPELIELMEAACNGELADAQLDRLQEMLQSDADARTAYVRYMGLDADLWLGAADGLAVPADRTDVERSPAESGQAGIVATPPPSENFGGMFRASAPSLMVGVLLGALVVVGLWVSGNKSDATGAAPMPTPVAYLSRAVDANWQSAQQTSLRCGDRLLSGRYVALREGLAEVTFECGARVILEGPATLELVSDTRCHLHAGRLVARIPPQATGFVVATPSTTIVDMGTEFGVAVDEQDCTEVVVFEGELDVRRPPHEDPATARTMPDSFRLTEDEAVRIAMDRVDDDAQVDPGRYVRDEEMTARTRTVALQDDFSAEKLDAERWTTRLEAPRAAVNVRDGQVELVNRGYLATAWQFDPVKLGGIRVTGRWTFVTLEGATGNAEVNIMTIALRSGLTGRERWFETDSGLTFTCYTSSRWPSVHARGDELEITTARRLGNLARDHGKTYQFEILDDGKNITCKFWDPDDPASVAESTAIVTRDNSRYNHIVFYCREAQGTDWTYKALLDDVVIETGVGPCR